MARDTAAIGTDVVIGSNTPDVETTVEALIRQYNRQPLDTGLSEGDLVYWDDTAGNWVRVSGTKAEGQVPSVQADGTLAWEAAGTGTSSLLGFPHNINPSYLTSNSVVGSNAFYYRSYDGGDISSVGTHVNSSSGNISVAVYTNSGSGRAATPTGGRLATSGAVACPAAGFATVSLGGTVSPVAGDWLAISADNATATFRSLPDGFGASALGQGASFRESGAHPCPATPTVADAIGRTVGLIGVA